MIHGQSMDCLFRKRRNNMFSNGTEHRCFIGRECNTCPHYVHYTEATKENPVCPIEERIAEVAAGIKEEKDFPYEFLKEDGTMAVYQCTKRKEALRWQEKASIKPQPN
jgi:hypothetical protein